MAIKEYQLDLFFIFNKISDVSAIYTMQLSIARNYLMSLLLGLIIGIGLTSGVVWLLWPQGGIDLHTPFITSTFLEEKPLQQFAIDRLAEIVYTPNPLIVGKVITSTPEYSSYVFTYTTLGKNMSGAINIPSTLQYDIPPKIIVMLRGYAPYPGYYTGFGTKNASAVFAKDGYITIAPDFLGYGDSDPAPDNSWQGRFEKPAQVIELLKSIQTKGIIFQQDDNTQVQILPTSTFGLWGHSNGGQIALSVLQALHQPIPTTLWAPVLAPFPYSVLFFTNTDDDEGKSMRRYIAMLEKEYDVFDFSITKHLDKVVGPLQLHHGGNDADALKSWSDIFSQSIKQENLRRTQQATTSAAPAEEIEFTYYQYPQADHNLQPDWNTVVERDLEFFRKHLPIR